MSSLRVQVGRPNAEVRFGSYVRLTCMLRDGRADYWLVILKSHDIFVMTHSSCPRWERPCGRRILPRLCWKETNAPCPIPSPFSWRKGGKQWHPIW